MSVLFVFMNFFEWLRSLTKLILLRAGVK
jgi:hypothetical protein